jgi:membrane protein implicated in regulation of membrane protease activity
MIEDYMIWVWLGVFLIALVVEASTQEFVSVWFSAGALVAMCICFFVPFYVEIIVFAVVSLAALILTRPLIKKMTARSERFTNTDEFVGKRVMLEKDVTKFEAGEIKINGVIYQAVLSEDSDEDIKKGSVVEMVAFKGNKVIVRMVETKEEL